MISAQTPSLLSPWTSSVSLRSRAPSRAIGFGSIQPHTPSDPPHCAEPARIAALSPRPAGKRVTHYSLIRSQPFQSGPRPATLTPAGANHDFSIFLHLTEHESLVTTSSRSAPPLE